jgi:uncharacterized protein
MSEPIKLVVDTNVVIDWLVFDDAFMNPLRHGVMDGRITVITHQPAVNELKRVLAYKQLKLDVERQENIFAHYCKLTQLVPTVPSNATPINFPRCSDRDDQHFLALAWHCKIEALLTRDNAVLGLKKRVAAFGVTILNVQQAMAYLS